MPGTLNKSRQIILIAHNIRSSHNIGSLFRTAEGLGVSELVLSGYTPYPREPGDERLEYLIAAAEKQISKTALGAQNMLKWWRTDNLVGTLKTYRQQGFYIYALEQDPKSHSLLKETPAEKTVIVIGNEVTGLEEEILKLCQEIIEIPMLGKKESFNVVQAAAMALFYFRYY